MKLSLDQLVDEFNQAHPLNEVMDAKWQTYLTSGNCSGHELFSSGPLSYMSFGLLPQEKILFGKIAQAAAQNDRWVALKTAIPRSAYATIKAGGRPREPLNGHESYAWIADSVRRDSITIHTFRESGCDIFYVLPSVGLIQRYAAAFANQPPAYGAPEGNI